MVLNWAELSLEGDFDEQGGKKQRGWYGDETNTGDEKLNYWSITELTLVAYYYAGPSLGFSSGGAKNQKESQEAEGGATF